MMILLIVLGIILQATFVVVETQEKYQAAVILKGSASLCFVLLGIIAAQNSSGILGFSKLIIAGLIFGMAGDILLNMRYLFEKNGQKVFLVGILIFMIGHVMYLIALLKEAVNCLVPIAIGVVLAALLLLWIFSKVTAAKAFKIFGVFYVGAVTVMAVTGVWNGIFMAGSKDLIFAVGGILFLISDVILIFNTFTGSSKLSMRVMNLSLYYIGQILIACSLMYV